jgi:hypothetical protein
MLPTVVYAEPSDLTDGSFSGLAEWCQLSGSREARAARKAVNDWYAAYPDRDDMVLSRLRSASESGILQALDELYAYHLLSQVCRVRYEEDQTSPDFRLYRPPEHLVASVEVCTLFPEQQFSDEIDRNARLVDAINQRIRPSNWYVGLSIIDWKRQPRMVDLERWLKEKMAALGVPSPKLPRDEYPRDIYSVPGMRLEFTFHPRRKQTPPTETEPLVAFGPAVGGFLKPERRIRNAVGRKAGGRYDHRGKPFAVLLSVRDFGCDAEDVVNALYGDEVVRLRRDNPGTAQIDRRRNGMFTISKRNPTGRHRRLSCVFVLLRGWRPETPDTAPKLFRFDNPFAEQAFPDNLLMPHGRFMTRRDDSSIRMEWESRAEPTREDS